jgi:hypothetical protein
VANETHFGLSRWVVADVVDLARSRRVLVPGMTAIVATSPDTAQARARDCLDSWLSRVRTYHTPGLAVPHPEQLVQCACPRCAGAQSRIVGQSGQQPLIHRECDSCGHVWYVALDGEDGVAYWLKLNADQK